MFSIPTPIYLLYHILNILRSVWWGWDGWGWASCLYFVHDNVLFVLYCFALYCVVLFCFVMYSNVCLSYLCFYPMYVLNVFYVVHFCMCLWDPLENEMLHLKGLSLNKFNSKHRASGSLFLALLSSQRVPSALFHPGLHSPQSKPYSSHWTHQNNTGQFGDNFPWLSKIHSGRPKSLFTRQESKRIPAVCHMYHPSGEDTG